MSVKEYQLRFYKETKKLAGICFDNIHMLIRSRAENVRGKRVFVLPGMRDVLEQSVEVKLKNLTQEAYDRRIALSDGDKTLGVDISALPGTRFYRRVYEIIKMFRNGPRRNQWQLVNAAVQTFLPVIYSGATEEFPPPEEEPTPWQLYKEEICKYLNVPVPDEKLGMFISTPRRFGKTQSMVIAVTSLLLAVPGFTSMVLSTSKRVSSIFSTRVDEYIALLPGALERVVVKNQEQFTIVPIGVRFDNVLMRSDLRALPASVNTNRGTGAKAIIIDEGAFAKTAFLMSLVFPMLQVENTRLLCISSPASDSTSVFSIIIRRFASSNFFRVIVITTTCNACIKANLSECHHYGDSRPPWVSVDSVRALTKVMAVLDEGAKRREIDGQVDDSSAAFDTNLIEKLMLPSTAVIYSIDRETMWRPELIFVGLDPSGGGMGSNVASVSFFFTTSGNIVVSAMRVLR